MCCQHPNSVSGNELSLRLLSPGMPDDDELYRKRLGFWLRAARERSGKSQQGAAEKIGLSPKSKSTISDYEAGATPIPLKALRILAAWYEVPLSVFTEPDATPEERIDEIVRLAGQREQRQWDEAGAQAPAGGDAPAASPERLTA